MKLLIAFLLIAGLLRPASGETAQPLNVLFISVDDMKVQLGCYGSPLVKTPNIDRLASRGTLFTRAYCQQTVCNPSRASVLTGFRPDTIRVWDLPTHFRVHKPDAATLPQWFKRNGYHSRGVGKVFHNWRQDDWKGDPDSWSVPATLHYDTHGNDAPKVEGELPPDYATVENQTECREVPDDAYYDGRAAAEAVRALRELGESGQPFFLAVGFWKPHLPFNAPKKYWDLYDRSEIQLPESLTPPADVPEIALTSDRIEGRYGREELLELHHGYLATMTYVDAQVGKVLDELNALGLNENTIVVFWSDHGLHIGEHGLMRKTTLFEVDARIPLIFSVPNRPGGRRVDGLVELLDLYPTLVELCGMAPPKGLEGISLVPLLEDPTRTVRKAALTQTTRPNYPRGEDPVTMGYSIRTEDFRYNEWREFKTGEIQARELYDHRRDPGETKNLAQDEQYAGVVESLARLMGETLPSSVPWTGPNPR